MDTKQREQIDKGIETCNSIIRTFVGLKGALEVMKLTGDIGLLSEQLQALNKETKKAKATVHDINEARKATKQ